MSNFAAITLLDGFALIRQAVFREICRKEQGDKGNTEYGSRPESARARQPNGSPSASYGSITG